MVDNGVGLYYYNYRLKSGGEIMNKRLTLRKQLLCGIFAAIIAILTQISIPLPSGVPFTMQVFAILLTAIVLGPRLGTISVLVYILVGAIGAPVFTLFRGGYQMLAGVTGGYLIAYPFTAAILGYFSYKFKKNYFMIFLGGMLGLIFCYIVGTTQLALVLNLTPKAAIMAGAIPFIPFDIVKLVLAIILGTTLKNRLEKMNILRD